MKGVVNRFSFEGDVNRPTFCCHKNYQILAMQQSIAIFGWVYCIGNSQRNFAPRRSRCALRRENRLAEKFQTFRRSSANVIVIFPQPPKVPQASRASGKSERARVRKGRTSEGNE